MHIPETHQETQAGVYERLITSDSTSSEIQDSYKERAKKILKLDERHYRKHAPRIRKQIEEAGIHLHHCVAWAGGHPKLEASAGFGLIDVVDACAGMYEETDKEFQDVYGPAKVQYVQMAIDPDTVGLHRQNVDQGTPNTFVHFLEHLTASQTIALLKACEGSPIIIYGPNIQKADGPDWFHFKPKDHNTFWTATALGTLLDSIGYTHITATEIDEDYLIVATIKG